MNLPDKPTSGSWLADLQALAEMGATSVDIRTALGAVEELTAEIERLKQIFRNLDDDDYSKAVLDNCMQLFGDDAEVGR